jgi:hypothetical protein
MSLQLKPTVAAANDDRREAASSCGAILDMIGCQSCEDNYGWSELVDEKMRDGRFLPDPSFFLVYDFRSHAIKEKGVLIDLNE